MRESYIPALARAFFKLDQEFLARNCRETAMAQMKAVAAARAVEGLSHDGQVLAVSRVELMQARTLDSSDSGTLPVIVLSCQVQYIHCVRNKKVGTTCHEYARALSLSLSVPLLLLRLTSVAGTTLARL